MSSFDKVPETYSNFEKRGPPSVLPQNDQENREIIAENESEIGLCK